MVSIVFFFFFIFFFCKLVLRGHSRDHGESIKSGRHQIYSTGSDPFEFAFPFLFPTPFRRPPRLMNSVIDWTFFFCWRHHFSVSSGRCGDVEVMDDSAATPGSPRSISFFFNHFLFVHFFLRGGGGSVHSEVDESKRWLILWVHKVAFFFFYFSSASGQRWWTMRSFHDWNFHDVARNSIKLDLILTCSWCWSTSTAWPSPYHWTRLQLWS